MENITTTGIPYFIKNDNLSKTIYHSSSQVGVIEADPVFEKLTDEGCGNFYNYIEWLGLAKDTNLTILSSAHHYFYDTEELKEVKTVVNLKQLNNIKQIKDFLHKIFHILPQRSCLIGCFIDNKNQNGSFLNLFKAQNHIPRQFDQVENGIASSVPILNMMYNILDSKTYRYLSKRTVTLMLGDAGLKVLDMTELNGLTFFCAQKVRTVYN